MQELSKTAYRHLSKKEKEEYNVARGKGCFVTFLKKDGTPAKSKIYKDFGINCPTSEDIVAYFEKLNPGSKFVVVS